MSELSWLLVANVFSLIANGFAAGRVIALGIYRFYPFLFSYLVFQFFVNLAGIAFGPSSPAYAWIYAVGAPVQWILYILIVRELYTLLFREYPGISTVARWTLYSGAAVAFVVSGILLLATVQTVRNSYSKLDYIEIAERQVVFSLVVFLLLVLFVLSRYPIRLARNVVVHSWLYSALFLIEAALLLVAQGDLPFLHITGDMRRQINLAMVIVNGIAYAGWALFLTREGQVTVLKVRTLNPLDEERLLQQLGALNSSLLRVVRR